jgi:hypothetical protein
MYVLELSCIFPSYVTNLFPIQRNDEIFAQLFTAIPQTQQPHSSDCRYGSCVWRPDGWLEVSVHQEGPAAGQLYQSFPWFSSVLEQMLRRYPKSTLHLCRPPWHLAPEFSPKHSPPNTINISSHCCPQNTKFSPNVQFLPSAAKSQNSTSQRITFFTSQSFTLLPAYGYRKGERALSGNFQSYSFGPHPEIIIIIIITIAPFNTLSSCQSANSYTCIIHRVRTRNVADHTVSPTPVFLSAL